MRRFLARFGEHAILADFITATPAFKLSVYTGGWLCFRPIVHHFSLVEFEPLLMLAELWGTLRQPHSQSRS
jgi:hypothetical protein